MIEMKTETGWSVNASGCNDTFLLKAICNLDGTEHMFSTISNDDNRMYLARYGVQLTEGEVEYLNDQLIQASE